MAPGILDRVSVPVRLVSTGASGSVRRRETGCGRLRRARGDSVRDEIADLAASSHSGGGRRSLTSSVVCGGGMMARPAGVF